MNQHYADILALTTMEPRWWDEHGVPRFCQFSPDEIANVYADQVALLPVPDKARITYLDESTPLDRNKHLLGPWNSPSTMTRWASRLTVEIVAIRALRVQGITPADAVASGAADLLLNSDHPLHRKVFERVRVVVNGETFDGHAGAVDAFAAQWDDRHDKRHPWKANPWAWAVSMRRVHAESLVKRGPTHVTFGHGDGTVTCEACGETGDARALRTECVAKWTAGDLRGAVPAHPFHLRRNARHARVVAMLEARVAAGVATAQDIAWLSQHKDRP